MSNFSLPRSFSDDDFVRLSESHVSTPLERQLWERLAFVIGSPDVPQANIFGGKYDGFSREDLCVMLDESESEVSRLEALAEERLGEINDMSLEIEDLKAAVQATA